MLAVLLLAGCKDDEPAVESAVEPMITVAISSFSIDNAAGSETTATFTVNADWITDRKSTRLNSSH